MTELQFICLIVFQILFLLHLAADIFFTKSNGKFESQWRKIIHEWLITNSDQIAKSMLRDIEIGTRLNLIEKQLKAKKATKAKKTGRTSRRSK